MAQDGRKPLPQKATIRIQRFNPDVDQKPYFDTFETQVTPDTTILDALEAIKAIPDGSLTFRRSCRHGICGSCAMNINGVNILACSQALANHINGAGEVTIRPLPYLTVVKDLVVERTPFWEQYRRVKPWLIPSDSLPEKEFRVMPAEVEALNSAETCIMCGACYSACPVINLDKEFVGPHAMLKAFMRVSDPRDSAPSEHIVDIASVWDCTTCFKCNTQCPKDLDPGAVTATIRSTLVEKGAVPRSIGTALTSTFRNNNPFEMIHADRLAWAESLALKNALAEPVDALYFVCCLACYEPRAQKAAQAMVKVMNAAGIDLGTLGSEEACCGSEIHRLGEMGLFEMMVEERTETLSMAQTQKIITTSPHCFNIYKNHYPDLKYPIEHYTQYVARLIADGRLNIKGEVKKKVTYHDPCYLGIQNQVFDEPRAILQSIPGVEVVEMAHSRDISLCCGGGGGRMWFEGHNPEASLSHERVREAVDTGADILTTACPFCQNMLDDAVKTLGLDDQIEVKDLMELVVKAL
jgi:succinate dehydrogenase/fumarate reductase iron-sulfur protein